VSDAKTIESHPTDSNTPALEGAGVSE